MYHFNIARRNNVRSNLATLSLHKNTLSLELTFNSSMSKYVKCGWSLNLCIYFFSYTKHYLQNIGYIRVKVFKNRPSKICGRHPIKNFTWSILEYFDPFDALLIRTILDKNR